jgi:hypothetical protein
VAGGGLALVLPADCLTPGANFAQEAKWGSSHRSVGALRRLT